MITCQTFRANLVPGTNDPQLLEHLRHCDACLDYAASIDPDLMFRAIGGGELVPPGGIDAFASDVMREVRLRQTESRIDPHQSLSWRQRLAIAATLAAGVTGGALVYHHEQRSAGPMAPVIAAVRPQAIEPAKLTIKPVVERYESTNATIVEVPTDGATDTKVVMIVDDQLPADL